MRTLKPCGTTAAFNRHYANGETPCDPCKAAKSAEHARRKEIITHLPPVERVLAGPPPVTPVVVLCTPAGRWAAVCVAPACGPLHELDLAADTARAAETAADTHLKELHAAGAHRMELAA